jgi:hypothetical protein
MTSPGSGAHLGPSKLDRFTHNYATQKYRISTTLAIDLQQGYNDLVATVSSYKQLRIRHPFRKFTARSDRYEERTHTLARARTHTHTHTHTGCRNRARTSHDGGTSATPCTCDSALNSNRSDAIRVYIAIRVNAKVSRRVHALTRAAASSMRIITMSAKTTNNLHTKHDKRYT